jgi:hypothetical protein
VPATKPFSQELYDEDDNAKQVLIDYLNRKGGFENARVNPDQYGIDVLAERDGVTHGFEVEVKHNWTGSKFPFSTIHFADRKRKFAVPNAHFVMFNDNRSCALTVMAEIFALAPVVAKKTVYTELENFTELRLNQVVFFTL